MTISESDAPSLLTDIVAGVWRFTGVALLGFAPWAIAGSWFYRTTGELGLYCACLVSFLLGALLFLPGLMPTTFSWGGRCKRTALYFFPGFVLYAIVWCLCWFLLKGKTGEWSGAILGGLVFTYYCTWALQRPQKTMHVRRLLVVSVIFIATHAIGYFSGETAMSWVTTQSGMKTLGMWAWGLCYGIGFGAGLGYIIHVCHNK